MKFRFVHHDSPLATAVFTFRAGSFVDPPGQEGISHHLEHVLLDASVKYPSEKHVTDAFGRLGAITNGGTGHSGVSYYGTCRAKKLLDMIDIHCNLVSAPLLTDDDIERERQVVLSELKDYLDDAVDVFFHEVKASALGWAPIIGHEHTVAAITPEQMRHHYHRFHGTDNLMVVVCGPEPMEEEIRDRLSSLPAGEATSYPGLDAPNLDDLNFTNSKFEQTQFALIGSHSPGTGAPFRDSVIASMASSCIAGPEFSLLFRRLRSDLGLCYWVSAGSLRHDGGGTLFVWSQFEPDKTDMVQKETIDTLAKVANDGIDEEIVRFTKDIILTSAAQTQETSAGRANQFMSYRMAGATGVPDTYDEYEALVEGIGPDEVSQFAASHYGVMATESKVVCMMPK